MFSVASWAPTVRPGPLCLLGQALSRLPSVLVFSPTCLLSSRSKQVIVLTVCRPSVYRCRAPLHSCPLFPGWPPCHHMLASSYLFIKAQSSDCFLRAIFPERPSLSWAFGAWSVCQLKVWLTVSGPKSYQGSRGGSIISQYQPCGLEQNT